MKTGYGNRSIGIIGADGFIGSNLKARLDFLNLTYECFDAKKHRLLDVASLESFVRDKKVIFHVAGAPREAGIDEFVSTNVAGTINLLEAMKQFGPKDTKIIFPSTVHVYAPTKILHKYKEDEKTLSSGIGGLSKKLAEEAIAHYANKFGIKYVILRLTNTYGSDSKPFKNSVIATLLHCVKNNMDFPVEGGGLGERDYIHIDDVIDACMLSKDHTANDIFNICSGKPINVINLVNQFEKIYGKRVKLNIKSKGAKDYLIGDPLKAKKKLKWQSAINLREGITQVVRSKAYV